MSECKPTKTEKAKGERLQRSERPITDDTTGQTWKRGRPVRSAHYIWCDIHSEIHRKEHDFYKEGFSTGDPYGCNPINWRTVYVQGTKDEEF